MARTLTLAEKLSLEDNRTLFNIFSEIQTGVVPFNGYAHEYCRRFNRDVDLGKACINTSTYRHVYLPTLSKAVMLEISIRWADNILRTGDNRAPEPECMSREYIKEFIDGMSSQQGFYRRLRSELMDEDYEYLESLNLKDEFELIEALERY